jgi:DNA excision repair protein ERCC-2
VVAPAAAQWEIRVRGRLDGLIEELDRLVVEELKTVTLSSAAFAALKSADLPRHRRQLEIYLHLLAIARPDKIPHGRLIYLNLPTEKTRSFDVPYDPAVIEPLLWETVVFLIQQESRRAQERLQKQDLAHQLTFPHPNYRPGQETMLEAICEALNNGSRLLLEAPTGLGKTAAALYGVLPYALENDKQILFLTSKTTQQEHVFATAEKIRRDHPFPRTLLLRARQKLCPLGSGEVEPEECPYIEDFQRRLRESGLFFQLLEEGGLHPDHLREVGERHRLCPHELQLALCTEMDLIIGDYNYAFDPDVRLERLFGQSGDPLRLILVVDEAHNLPERARSYYSPQLPWSGVSAALQKLAEKDNRSLAEPLQAIQAQFEYYLAQAPPDPEPMPIQLSSPAWEKMITGFESAVVPYWFGVAAAGTRPQEDPVLLLWRALQDFGRVLALEGDNFASLLRRRPEPELEILCLDAAPYLQDTFDSVHATLCLSATLQPFEAAARLLGMDKNLASLAVPNPFPRENCRVFVDPSVTTLYRERQANLQAMAERIEIFHRRVKRNILVFFPSFELMRSITARLKIRGLLMQGEGFTDSQRQQMLASFKQRRHGLLCAVMGGVFAEGIDLPGRLAEAVIIVGVGLPQVSTENELLRAYFERRDERGFEYAYLYLGMRRVLQAAGRVIRGETDRGIILLLDRRYAQKEYQRLLPRHWYKDHPAELVDPHWCEKIAQDSLFS